MEKFFIERGWSKNCTGEENKVAGEKLVWDWKSSGFKAKMHGNDEIERVGGKVARTSVSHA
jgi:hypothetical protein